MTAPQLKRKDAREVQEEDVCLFAQTDFRNQMRRFGIKLDDRRRHMYVIGKTGMGKTTMLENMVLHDIYAGHGVGIVDPHGDFAEKIIDYIPTRRINDVIYLNPADTGHPIGFNILEVKNEEQKHLIAGGLMATFKKIWPDVWSARMEYILNNTLLALLDYPGATLLGINRLLADKKYRLKVVNKLHDPVIKAFWQNEFAAYNDRYAQEAVAPIQNKIGQFLSASVIRNMVAQVKSTIDVRDIMDSGKIFVMNLAKGRIGEDNSRLLGGMLVNKIQISAMERVDTPEADRKDFFLYVDEFQNFATPSFANILSEARKYRLSLIMAHQYVKQLDELVADAVFGNVGTIIAFRVGGPDAEELVKEFTPTFLEEDILNLGKYHVFLKLMINGVASQPFSAMTMPPIGKPTGSADKVIRVSRERYAKPREEIEDKITRWSGMEISTDDESEESGDFDVDTTRERKGAAPVQLAPNQRPTISNSPATTKTIFLKELLAHGQSGGGSTLRSLAQPRPQLEPLPKRVEPTLSSTKPNQWQSHRVVPVLPQRGDSAPAVELSERQRRRRRRRNRGGGEGPPSQPDSHSTPTLQTLNTSAQQGSQSQFSPLLPTQFQKIQADQAVRFD